MYYTAEEGILVAVHLILNYSSLIVYAHNVTEAVSSGTSEVNNNCWLLSAAVNEENSTEIPESPDLLLKFIRIFIVIKLQRY